MPSFGLKLWSINTDHYLKAAERLYKEGVFDYIELYVVPGTLNTLDAWATLNIPFHVHAPHFAHGVNLADREKSRQNKAAYEEVAVFFHALKAKHTIVHCGIGGTIDETIRQIEVIRPLSMLVENKPHIAPAGENLRCRGATIDEIVHVMRACKCGFCLDIGHAICAANSLGIEAYQMLADFKKLCPSCYHLSDNDMASPIDRHLNFGQGNYDFSRIFALLGTLCDITIETNKSSRENLQDFVEDMMFIKGHIDV